MQNTKPQSLIASPSSSQCTRLESHGIEIIN